MNDDNTITDLRGHLFDTLRRLKDKDNPLEIERARAISDIAQTIINSAKAEVDYLRVAGGKGSGFIPEVTAVGLPDGTKVIGQKPGVTVTRHQLKG
jgi:hypothetical protein